jgi:HJR/Mrr/RecB family endonuclease
MSRGRKRKQDPLISLVILVAALVALSFADNPNFATNETSLLVIPLVIGVFLGLLAIGFIYLQGSKKRRALRALDMAAINGMSGIEFEHYVGALLEFNGYKITYTKTSGDYGIDIVARKSGIATAIQVKRYHNAVGEAAVQQSVAGMLHYKCSQSMVITNSTFTRYAHNLAQSNHCALIDGVKLGEWILAFQTGLRFGDR